MRCNPRAFFRIRRALERERFDVLHLHEPMTPAICTSVLVMARCPLVGTFHASGELGWMRYGKPLWGFLVDRLDHRIAVSERARASQERWLPGEYEVVPNGVLVPGSARVRRQAEEEGLDRVFLDAGFEWRLAGCSMCLGMNPDVLGPGERCASTSNRNFEGRQGRGGRTHLVSPQMAAAAALHGHFVDVRTLDLAGAPA